METRAQSTRTNNVIRNLIWKENTESRKRFSIEVLGKKELSCTFFAKSCQSVCGQKTKGNRGRLQQRNLLCISLWSVIFLLKGIYYKLLLAHVGGAVASWSVRSFPERAVWDRTLAGDIVLCSRTRHSFCGEVTCEGLTSRPRRVEILLAASCYRDKLLQL